MLNVMNTKDIFNEKKKRKKRARPRKKKMSAKLIGSKEFRN